MPESVVIPVLAYADVRAACSWLCGAFGFVERLRIGEHRAQLSFGSGSIAVAAAPADALAQPRTHAGSFSVMVRVANVDAHYARAKEFHATVLSPPTDFPYGERQYSVQDIGGYVWTFSQSIADVDPSDWGGVLSHS